MKIGKIIRLLEPIFLLFLIIWLLNNNLQSWAFLIAIYVILRLILNRLIDIENKTRELETRLDNLENKKK